jgi:hypothetical protein
MPEPKPPPAVATRKELDELADQVAQLAELVAPLVGEEPRKQLLALAKRVRG